MPKIIWGEGGGLAAYSQDVDRQRTCLAEGASEWLKGTVLLVAGSLAEEEGLGAAEGGEATGIREMGCDALQRPVCIGDEGSLTHDACHHGRDTPATDQVAPRALADRGCHELLADGADEHGQDPSRVLVL